MDAAELTLDDLYLQLGSELSIDGFGGEDRRLLKARAQTWLSANNNRLKEIVCPRSKEFAETAVDVSALADAISVLVGKPACFTVAAIIVKFGLKNFCAP
ncbi:hypothetical protein [Actinoplanes sp. URMC 104]|uniref:hypothetical protein n=1 Tax=Actinoplanes sp. URMC 104 TaxID=3423409 RepID=UPI003F1E194D